MCTLSCLVMIHYILVKQFGNIHKGQCLANFKATHKSPVDCKGNIKNYLYVIDLLTSLFSFPVFTPTSLLIPFLEYNSDYILKILFLKNGTKFINITNNLILIVIVITVTSHHFNSLSY